MAFGAQSQLSTKAHQRTKLPDCIFERPQKDKRNCSMEVQLPVIKEPRRKNCKKGIPNDKSPKDDIQQDINLPKLWASPKRMDAGEPSDIPALEHSVEQFSIDSNKKCSPFKRSEWFESSSDTSEESGRFRREIDIFDDTSSNSKFYEKINDQKEKLEECNALKRWKYWMEDKKAMRDYLSKKIERDPQDLQLQESDKYRQVMERKLMLWYSRIPEPDKWRGSPARWKPALRIRGIKSRPPYCLVKSKVEKEERPELEIIGLPNSIKKEKGLIVEQMRWKEEKKKPTRDHGLEETSSHEIEMAKLEIIGEKISLADDYDKNSKSINCPQIIEPESKENNHKLDFGIKKSASACIGLDERPSIFCLVIDGKEIKYKIGTDCCQDPDRMLEWQVTFDVNAIESIVERVLRIENRGTMAVRYDWLSPKTLQQLSSNALQCNPKQYEPWFFFNKNSGFFLPGQIYDLKFYFYAKTSGIRKEMWYLKTTPPLPSKLKYATITLSGVATEEFSKSTPLLGRYLHNQALRTCISALLDAIINRVMYTIGSLEHIEYRSVFSEKDLFEHHNPQCYYHSMIVKQLKESFKEIPNKVQTEWDFSLHSLVDIIKTHKEGKERKDFLSDVSRKAIALLRPSYVSVKSVKKYRMTYAILCKMVNFMEEDYFYFRNLFFERVEDSSTWSEPGEANEASVGSSLMEEEMGESNFKKEIFEIKPINLMFFQNLFYLKVYYRICEAVEHMVGILETRKFLEPWKQVSQKPIKPPRVGKLPTDHLTAKRLPVTSPCETKSVREECLKKD